MNILFRADASLQIGTGHVMRCLTLAQALRDRNSNCRFICRDHRGNLLDRIRQAGFDAIILPATSPPNSSEELDPPILAHTDWLGSTWQVDTKQTVAALGDVRPDWIIVDHYALDARWESALRPYCDRIMVIDDLADRRHDCDLLLDQNLVADLEQRYDGLLPSHCARLLGPTYALLQPQYAELHPRTPPRLGPIRRILVFFGGSDQHNLTGRAVAAFLALERPDIALDVVINPASPHAAAIREQANAQSNITVHGTLPSLAPLMLKADLAIGAGGATSWERCCLGLPSLVITLADNQRPVADELARRGLIQWLGHGDEGSEATLAQLLRDITDRRLSSEWFQNCQGMVDGQGTKRVLEVIYHGDSIDESFLTELRNLVD